MKEAKRKKLLILLVVLSLIGLGFATYQTYEHYTLADSVCDFTENFSCSVVTESKWGEFPFYSGIALALYGMVWWLVLLGILGYCFTKRFKTIEYYLFLWLGLGVITILYLVAVELYFLPLETGVIVICPFCTVQHVIILLGFILSFFLLKKPLRTYKLDPRPVFIFTVIALIAVGGYFILWKQVGGQEHFAFAECLQREGATMYGFDACPNCNKQKYLIGNEAFKTHITDAGLYVKCRPTEEAILPIGDRLDIISVLPGMDLTKEVTQAELCALMVGRGTPTWIIKGVQVDGWQSLETLAELSGCPLEEQ